MSLTRVLGIAFLSIWLGACGGSADVADASGGADGAGGSGGTGTGGGTNGTGSGGDLDIGSGGSTECAPTTCEALGKNCGIVADGCGDVLNCGTCDEGMHCGAFEDNVCPTPEQYDDLCQPRSQEEACASKECGTDTDGCGNSYNCGTCDEGEACGLDAPFQCGVLPVYTDDDCPAEILSCAAVDVECGQIGNGCGGLIDCNAETGGCGAGESCGMGGPGVCGPEVTCTTRDPAEACAGTCGFVSDGCLGQIDCSTVSPCPAGQTCGGGGIHNQCGSGTTACAPASQAVACGTSQCGFASDGCGGSHPCGTCSDGQVCRQGACVAVGCTPLTEAQACEDQGRECGIVSNGCGGTYNCGSCQSPDQCGFLEPFQCDLNPNLQDPEQCVAEAPAVACAGRQCGVVFDGCGTAASNQIDCATVNGGCGPGQFCGLTTPFQCAAPQQPDCNDTRQSCADLGWGCGVAINDCGETFDCADDGLVCSGIQTCIGGLNGNPTECVNPGGVDGCPLCDAIPSCSEDTPIRLTGRVITPGQPGSSATNHVGVPNAFVYILRTNDEGDLPGIDEGVPTDGTSCDRCVDQDLGPVLVSGMTNAEGHFTLTRNIPVGEEFLLVVKVGKFRRAQRMTLQNSQFPNSDPCNTLALATTMPNNPTRLPRDMGDGVAVHIPRIALATGAIDAMECVFYKMGIAPGEFTRPALDGRIHLYRSNGAWPDQQSLSCNNCTTQTCRQNNCQGGTTQAQAAFLAALNIGRLHESGGRIPEYDMTVFDCEGADWDGTAGGSIARSSHNVREYANRGGRVFASHLSFTWLHANADEHGTQPYDPGNPFITGLGLASSWSFDTSSLYASGQGQITLPQLVNPWPWNGSADENIGHFASWMTQEGIASGPNYTFNLTEPRSMTTGPGDHTDIFVRVTNNDQRVQQFSFNTPYGAPTNAACGRVAYSGFHVSVGGGFTPFQNQVFPNHCTSSTLGNSGNLTNQEKILLYMLFDLGACVGEDPDPPECEPVACPADGTCGTRADGCGSSQECGCPSGEACVGGQCEPVDCIPLADCGGLTCTSVADGCGGALVCPCPVCEPVSEQEACATVSCGYASDGCSDVYFCGLCPPDCEPLDECPDHLDCGTIGDGCNDVLNCGDCPEGVYCGAGGLPNVCGVPECEPLSCDDLNAQCGYIGDGCGGSENCGPCPQGQVCTTVDGVPNQCTGCQPLTCDAVGAQCGMIGDGCGGTVNCGPCPSGQFCGAQAPNQCGDGPGCTPLTCAAVNAQCGVIGDGCGGTVNCGPCPTGQVCGIETPFRCGPPPPCTPKTCSSLQAECGLIGDGCGGLLDCGNCPAGAICGQEEANRCGPIVR